MNAEIVEALKANVEAEMARYPKGRRGFAAMSPARQSEIASKGGKAAQARGTAYAWTRKTASAAGAKGGATVSRNREHMAAIGRAGGLARAARLKARAEGVA